MSLQTYNTIELRYADTELAKNQFVKLADVEEELTILRAERSHWHHMYNNSLDERPDI